MAGLRVYKKFYVLNKINLLFVTSNPTSPMGNNFHKGKFNELLKSRIQYKVIEGQLTIVGINEGSELVAKEFLKHKTIPLGNAVFTNFETQLEIKTEELRVTEELFSYRFETPWLPINQKNLKAYKNGELDLDRVLSNNILTIFKGCKIEADKKIMVKGEYEEKSIKMKDIHMIKNWKNSLKILT